MAYGNPTKAEHEDEHIISVMSIGSYSEYMPLCLCVEGQARCRRRPTVGLRVPFLFVFALAALVYIVSYVVLDALPLKNYIHPPFNYNNTERDEIRSRTKYTLSNAQKLNQLKATSTKVVLTNNTLLAHNSSLSPNSTTISHGILLSGIVSEYNPIPDIYQNKSTTLLSKLKRAVTSNTSTPTVVDDVKSIEYNNSDLPQCVVADDLGPVTVNKSEILTLKDIDQKYPQVLRGGIHSQKNCTTQDKVAIIVPFRNREQHLAIFLNHIHPFLMKQPIEYGIYIVEQYGNSKFNRAKLFNVGYAEAQRLSTNYWKCFVFHDVDLLPLDTRNLYTCPKQPRHMSVAVDTLRFRLIYQELFGGVTALSVAQFQHVNGFSNRYWGWGGEDDDMAERVFSKHYHIARYKTSIARYAMLDHKKSKPNPKRHKLLEETEKSIKEDGISNLVYKVVKVQQFHLFTHIIANIDEIGRLEYCANLRFPFG